MESGRAVEKLANYARSLGVEIQEGQTAQEFIFEKIESKRRALQDPAIAFF